MYFGVQIPGKTLDPKAGSGVAVRALGPLEDL